MRTAPLFILALFLSAASHSQTRDFVVKPGTGQTETLDPNDLIRAHNDLAEFVVSLRVEGGRNTFAEGENVKFVVRSERAGYVTLLSQNSEGRVSFLFPNTYGESTRIRANENIYLPADEGYYFQAVPPFGLEYVKAIVTPEPLVDWDRVPASRSLEVRGPAQSDGGSTLGDFDPSQWATDEMTLRTVPRGTAAGPRVPLPPAPAPQYGENPVDRWDSLFRQFSTSGGSSRSLDSPRPPTAERAVGDPEDILVIYRPRTGTRSFGESVGGGHLLSNVRLVPADATAQNVSGTRSFGEYGQTIDQQVTALNEDPDVLVAVPDYPIQHFGIRPPDAPRGAAMGPPFVPAPDYWGLQWALHNGFYRSPSDRIDLGWLEGLQQYRSASEPVVVAVLDTGGLLDHPALRPFLWTNTDEVAGNGIDDDGNGFVDDVHGYDFVDDDGDPTDPNDSYSHGTFVATQIPYDPDARDLFGLAPNVRIMVVRVLGESGGRISSSTSGIDYAVQNGARVINLSLGLHFDTPHPEVERVYAEFIEAAAAAQVLVVSAAGNSAADSRTSYTYPARVSGPNTISVGALAMTGVRSGFSNFGPQVDVLAPGERIIGYASSNGAPEGLMGTSMSAPYVSAAAAMILSQHPSWRLSEVKARLLEHVTPLPGVDVATGGAVHIGRALAD